MTRLGTNEGRKTTRGVGGRGGVAKESFVPSTQEDVRRDSWGFWLTLKKKRAGPEVA
jgi:hypothetical protein